MFVCLWLCSDNCPRACQYLVGKIGGERTLNWATMSAHLIFCSFVLFCSLSYTAVWPIWLEILCSREAWLNSLGTAFSCDGNLQFRKFLSEKFEWSPKKRMLSHWASPLRLTSCDSFYSVPRIKHKTSAVEFEFTLYACAETTSTWFPWCMDVHSLSIQGQDCL